MFTSDGRDPHFPDLHLRPPLNWVNDPNGMVFHDGRYHVFFQYNPHSARHSSMHWGHFASADLLNWELLPTALAPTPHGDDEAGVWSGNAVSHDGLLTAFYSARHPERWFQPVATATSADGVHFTKRAGLVVPEPPPGLRMFRDPYVWRDQRDGRFRMLVGAGTEDGRGAAVQYESAADDLGSWTYRGEFFASAPVELPDGRDTEEGWECAQYAPFGDGRGALLVSCWDPDRGALATAAWPGRERDDGTFDAGAPQLLDHGPDFYAPALLPAPDGRLLMWAWIWEARDEEYVGAPGSWIDEAGWAGMLSLPRELSLDDQGVVRQRPARELDKLRTGERRAHASGRGPGDLGPVSRTCDVEAVLTGDGGLRLVTDADGREFLSIGRDPVTGDVVVDRAHASLDSRAKGGSWRLPAGPGGQARLRILLDHSVCEVFTDTGRALTLRFYPVGGAQWRLAATGGGPYTVDVWDLAAPGGSA